MEFPILIGTTDCNVTSSWHINFHLINVFRISELAVTASHCDVYTAGWRRHMVYVAAFFFQRLRYAGHLVVLSFTNCFTIIAASLVTVL